MAASRLLPPGVLDLAAYRAAGGYGALAAARADLDGLRTRLGETQLTGLGGAHFSFARKLQLALVAAGPRAVVCNAAEDEPGSRKDRTLLERNPHVVLEGTLIAAAALEADLVFVYVSEGLVDALGALDRALAELLAEPDATEHPEIRVVKAPDAYVAGEATAVVRALQGEEAKPGTQPPYPTESGVYGRPTLVSNCETLANLPRLLTAALDGAQPGTEWTRLVTVTGDVATEGVFEVVPGRTTFAHLIELAGGLTGEPPQLKAIQPGGPSSAYLDASAAETLLSNAAIVAAGSQPGCLAVRVLAQSRCLVEELVGVTAFFAQEQCGQCPPCRMKTQAYAQTVARIQRGEAGWKTLDQISAVDEFVSDLPRRCALISMPTPPLSSAVALFRADFQAHIDTAACAARG